MKAGKTFHAEHLAPAEELAGAPLAPRWRRAAALLVDGLLVFVPAVLLALGVSLLFLRGADPAAYAALKVLWNAEKRTPAQVQTAWGDLAPLLVNMDTPDLPEGLREAVKRGDRARAGELLKGHSLLFSLAIGEREEMHLPEGTIGFHFEKIIPKPLRALVLYGVMALYFTLFIASRRGATPGKRLLRIRVASLEGGRVRLLESLERFAAYIEIPATLGFALLALWRDPNRRLPHDRVAGTVVLLRVPEAAAPPQRPSGPQEGPSTTAPEGASGEGEAEADG